MVFQVSTGIMLSQQTGRDWPRKVLQRYPTKKGRLKHADLVELPSVVETYSVRHHIPRMREGWRPSSPSSPTRHLSASKELAKVIVHAATYRWVASNRQKSPMLQRGFKRRGGVRVRHGWELLVILVMPHGDPEWTQGQSWRGGGRGRGTRNLRRAKKHGI
ncbi:hypothetical protein IF1G_04558 [Cordyceps javanica]|uniref:Uncharacterized protein n=1 Tax=Cordyceps javanica TaxID=43265 RepID=A0A545V6I9_9HYPO|nr:hypothetical protein IF1G_04558 [Cordyceps javanica]